MFLKLLGVSEGSCLEERSPVGTDVSDMSNTDRGTSENKVVVALNESIKQAIFGRVVDSI